MKADSCGCSNRSINVQKYNCKRTGTGPENTKGAFMAVTGLETVLVSNSFNNEELLEES